MGGDSHHTEMALGRTRLGDECRHKAREGIWVMIQEGFGKHGEEVVDILGLIDLDNARDSYYSGVFKDRKRSRF